MRLDAALVAAAVVASSLVPTYAFGAGLRTLAEAADIRLGTAVNVDALEADPAYARLLAREFDLVTPENAMKFSVVHPERERYDFAQAATRLSRSPRRTACGSTATCWSGTSNCPTG